MSAARMKRAVLFVALFAASGLASAQDLLIRNATVHTASERGTLQAGDVLVRNGRIAAIGSGLTAGNATVVDAQGQPLTPALFAGITDIGVEEVSGESSTVDATLASRYHERFADHAVSISKKVQYLATGDWSPVD